MRRAALLTAVFITGYYTHITVEYGIRALMLRVYGRNGQDLVPLLVSQVNSGVISIDEARARLGLDPWKF